MLNILNKFIRKETKKVLGRWDVEICTTKINRKIDFSNDDHCGSCGQQYLLNDNLKNILVKQDFKIIKQ
jgi:hypothetical protein